MAIGGWDGSRRSGFGSGIRVGVAKTGDRRWQGQSRDGLKRRGRGKGGNRGGFGSGVGICWAKSRFNITRTINRGWGWGATWWVQCMQHAGRRVRGIVAMLARRNGGAKGNGRTSWSRWAAWWVQC